MEPAENQKKPMGGLTTHGCWEKSDAHTTSDRSSSVLHFLGFNLYIVVSDWLDFTKTYWGWGASKDWNESELTVERSLMDHFEVGQTMLDFVGSNSSRGKLLPQGG